MSKWSALLVMLREAYPVSTTLLEVTGSLSEGFGGNDSAVVASLSSMLAW